MGTPVSGFAFAVTVGERRESATHFAAHLNPLFPIVEVEKVRGSPTMGAATFLGGLCERLDAGRQPGACRGFSSVMGRVEKRLGGFSTLFSEFPTVPTASTTRGPIFLIFEKVSLGPSERGERPK